jgi:hypothetical protein
MKSLRPKEILVGTAWLTEVYDLGPLSTGSGIEEEEVTYYCSLEADYVAVCTEGEAAARGQLGPQARTETSGLIQECATSRDSGPDTRKEKGQLMFELLAFWRMM